MGSFHAMKKANATSCGIRFVEEKNDAARMALNAEKIWLRGSSRNVRVFEDHVPAKVCGRCLQVGHFQATCALPPRCRFCHKEHLSREHMCKEFNCLGQPGEACGHTVRICYLCQRMDHFAGYERCPARRANTSTPTPARPTPPSPQQATSETSASETSSEPRGRRRRRRRSRTRSPTSRVEEVTDDDEDVVLPKSDKAQGKEPAQASPSPSPPSSGMPKGILKASVTNPRRPDGAPDHWVYADKDGVVGSGPCGRSGSAESPF